jgi:hypothetical protein
VDQPLEEAVDPESVSKWVSECVGGGREGDEYSVCGLCARVNECEWLWILIGKHFFVL